MWDSLPPPLFPPRHIGVCDKCGGTLIHRPDDAEEVVKKRLKVYHAQTAPLIAFYSKQSLLHTISCSLDKRTVFQQITSLIESKNV